MDKIGIVAVTYNPNVQEFIKNINLNRNQADFVVVVDNSDETDKSVDLKNAVPKEVYLLQMNGNEGIAKAQNTGIEFCIKKGCKYILELDQDTIIPDYYISTLYSSIQRIRNKKIKIAGIGPVITDKDTGQQYYVKTGTEIIEVEKTISSGFIITAEAFKKVGPKDESLFIDFVDWEWNWRAKTKGFRTFVDSGIEIQHKVGESCDNFYFFRIFTHSPIRLYYKYRNAFILFNKKYTPVMWKVKGFPFLILQTLLLILFYDRKVRRITYLSLGLKHFFEGKIGKLQYKKTP